MGCGCGGSKRVGTPAPSTHGPNAEGYYWSGPKAAPNGPEPKQEAPAPEAPADSE